MSDRLDDPGARALTAAATGCLLALGLTIFLVVGYVLGAGHSESAEARSFVLTFGLATPLAAIGALVIVRRSAAPVDLQILVALGVGLAGIVFGSRPVAAVSGVRPLLTLFALLMVWIVLAAGVLAAAARGRRVPRLPAAALAGTTAGGVALMAAAFLSGEVGELGRLLVSVPVAVAFYAVMTLGQGRVRRPVAVAIDAVVGLVLLLVVSDVTPFPSADEAFNQNFVLGPVDRILHGGTVLVDTFSQYGVGMLYALAGWFSVAPLSYGSFALLIGILTAIQYAVIYTILRVAVGGRGLAILTVGCAVVLTIFTPIGSFVSYPSTGALRFGLGWLVVLSTTVGARRDPAGSLARASTLVLLAVASVWSLEALTYAGAAYAGVATLRAAASELPWRARLRSFVLLGAVGVATVLTTQLLFTIGTRLASGAWPAWGTYLDFLRLYSTGGFGQVLVYPWSWGLPLAMVYVFTLVGLICLVVEHREVVARDPAAFTAIAGTTTFGIATLTYYVGRSDPNNVLHIAPMAITVIALWLGVLRHGSTRAPRPVSVAAFALAAWLAAIMVVTAAPKVDRRWSRTAAAHLPRLDRPIDRLWSHSPVQDRRVLAAEHLLREHVPMGTDPVLLIGADLSVETLLRTGRRNALPWSNSTEDGLIPDDSIPRALRAIAALPSGSFALVQLPAPTPPSPTLSPVGPAPLLTVAQRAVAKRFHERFVAWDDGIALVRLERRS